MNAAGGGDNVLCCQKDSKVQTENLLHEKVPPLLGVKPFPGPQKQMCAWLICSQDGWRWGSPVDRRLPDAGFDSVDFAGGTLGVPRWGLVGVQLLTQVKPLKNGARNRME
jgi:hypothetical protein